MLINNRGPLLVAEDNDEDFETFQTSFRNCGATNEIIRCLDGHEVLELLNDRANKDELVFSLAILDLNLTGIDGREVLKRIRSDEKLRKLPVMVLSTSANPLDIDFCFRYGANCYSIKPVDLTRFENFVRLLKEFWLDNTILPYEPHGVVPGE